MINNPITSPLPRTSVSSSRSLSMNWRERGVGVAQIAWKADVEDHLARRERDLGVHAQESLVAARFTPSLVRQHFTLGDRRANRTVCRQCLASAHPGPTPHFRACRYWFGAWWAAYALAHTAVGQEPHHRSG